MTRILQNGRYEVLENIGAGASSRVERARDTIIGRIVALKTFVQGLNQGCEQQFLHEAKIIGQLSHPSIVQLYDVGTDENGAAYLVLEFVPGNTLEHLLTESPVPLRRACAWAADLASALAVSHAAGIIHSDVKPGNILVTGDLKVKLGDFGVARFAAHLSDSGRVTGTPAYLSPEQINGEKQDHRSDLFSLGIVLYEMTVGKRPFNGASLPAVCAQILNAGYIPPSQLDPSLPPAFDQVIARCLAKNPADRFQSAEELASNLYPLARASNGPSSTPELLSFSRAFRSPQVWVSAAALVLLASSALGLRSLHKHLQLPAAPAVALAAPKPPGDLLALSPQRSGEAVFSTPRLAPVPTRRSSPTRLASLNVDINSTSAEGTLAVFADQKLLLTTPLHLDGKNVSFQLKSQLPAGTHQFRVALYRSDKTLQSEKEGLADVLPDASNILGIHVGRHSKFLIRRESSLDVTWPSASSVAAEHTSSTATSTTVAEK